MKLTRLYTGQDGESHFEETELPLENKENFIRISEVMKASGIYFREVGKGHISHQHNAPRRQFVITLEGMLEIEIGDGSIRRFGPGDILLAEDTSGKGHIDRNVGDKKRITMVVTLD